MKRLAYAGFWIACLVLPAGLLPAQPADIDSAARRYYLNPLIHLPKYLPGKNSFLIRDLHRGDKRTVLDVKGSGSVRHIWSTWSIPGDNSDIPAAGRVRMNVFVDGHSKPTISGAIDDLCRAAERSGDRFAPLPAFNYKGAFNFYLPIFFDRGVRIEIEATDEIAEFYTQIDYRTGEKALHSTRLLSENNGASTIFKYAGGAPRWHATEFNKESAVRHTAVLDYSSSHSGELTLHGPGILRELTFQGDMLPDLELEIYWDDELSPSVQAPLQYFFSDFTNAAMESKSGRSTTYFPMPFEKRARLSIRSLSGRRGRVHIEYRLDAGPLGPRTLYFHAQYHETASTTGFAQYSVLEAQGEGLFVGMNLFNIGHNHGGGDAALIDPGTAHPLVLHGICGEDYFGFAWHHTGTMTPLTGAPVHERRYRLHLENPYPFHQSIQLLFGVFAGQHPQSVAFWYQLPAPTSRTRWITFDIPWKILGPAALDASLPNDVNDASYASVISLNQPVKVEERWQDIEMRSGFLDTTYQFRHYTMIEKGTGFVAGAGKTRITTYVHAPSQRKVNAIIGHDDDVTVSVNGGQAAELAAHSGFGPSRFSLELRAGWNKLDLVIYNDENVNWRWSGISLSFDSKNSADLKFASQVPESKE
ncbi:MAG: DUF2961 domain-containing protein [Acidobacteriales bacterium]|nr:DUF2961 domain-containing protein [Terriglobales bacterium]